MGRSDGNQDISYSYLKMEIVDPPDEMTPELWEKSFTPLLYHPSPLEIFHPPLHDFWEIPPLPGWNYVKYVQKYVGIIKTV